MLKSFGISSFRQIINCAVKLRSDITMNGRVYAKGTDIPWFMIYPFFLVHMLIFGASGFFMAYSAKGPPVLFLYAHGGIAIFVYTIFYLAIFGPDEVKWMFINALLGLLGIGCQINWLLSFFGKRIGDYPFYVHVIPFLYYVLYTFLLRHAVMDITQSRDDPAKRKIVENIYVAVSVAVYLLLYFLGKG
ncbi:MAG TPA: hypothetical protein VN516_02720 [Candidatus Baltobacteraceae bacterium]|nr:hypothetical protein [Candidatus Baltobacteraceae bacterium]